MDQLVSEMVAEALFNQIDEDQSGKLSLPELQSHLANLGFTDVDAEQLLFDLDTDKNGQVLVAMARRKSLRLRAIKHKALTVECLVGKSCGVRGGPSSIPATGRPHGTDRHPTTIGGVHAAAPFLVANAGRLPSQPTACIVSKRLQALPVCLTMHKDAIERRRVQNLPPHEAPAAAMRGMPLSKLVMVREENREWLETEEYNPHADRMQQKTMYEVRQLNFRDALPELLLWRWCLI